MFDLIMFDLDGTLTDPEEGITKSVQYALEAYGIQENDRNKLRRFIGPPLVDGFMNFYGMTREDALKSVDKYRERFSVVGLYENRLFDGAAEMLETLKSSNKVLALATSKPHIFASKILEHFNLSKYFDIVVGAELDGTRNEKKEVIKEVLKRADNCKYPVMIGDRKHDCIGALENGIPCIGVSFGFAEEGELEENGAFVIADDFNELIKILLKK